MDKFPQEVRDLIYFFTHNKNLTYQQQARRDKLLARDCYASTDFSDSDEDSVPSNSISPKEKASEASNNKEKSIWYISPSILHSLLYKFNQDDILKYSCHEIDSDDVINSINTFCGTSKYSFKKHSQLLRDRLDFLLNDFKREKIFLDNKFIGMLKAYLGYSQKEWSILKIKTNWNSQDIIEWSENYSGIVPSPGRNIARKNKNNGFILKNAIVSNLTGNRILSFKDLVLYFKSLFHIRRDNPLSDILKYQNNSKAFQDLNISFTYGIFNDNIDLLTDVDKLIQAYKSIIKICKETNPSDVLNIELSFYEENNSIIFTIHDKDHSYGKTLKSATERIGESQSNLIRNQINGLCNLYIEADFGNNEYARIGLWTNKSNELGGKPKIPVVYLSKAQGVKYILEFNWDDILI